MSLILRPSSLREANAFVEAHHRHHRPVRGSIFCIAVEKQSAIVGVAIVGRPVARRLQDGYTAEVTRLCTDGTKNAASMLLGSAARAAKAVGFRRIFTYILAEEAGVSLRAAGWDLDQKGAGGGTWSREGRSREDHHPTGKKTRWARVLQGGEP
jgi:hypothetical protein